MRYIYLSMLFLWGLLGMGLIIPNTVQARPVSYPGGWTFITTNDGDANSALLHYSPTAKTSFGYRFEDHRNQGFSIHGVQMNHLVKRWNEKDSQANLYLKSGLGFAYNHSGFSHPQAAGFIGIAADWENRRFFMSYQNRYTKAGDLSDSFMQSARVGVAPYVGDYGDLHTWLMLEVKHTAKEENNLSVTPLIRLFKDVHLLEAGVSNHGEILLNYIFRH